MTQFYSCHSMTFGKHFLKGILPYIILLDKVFKNKLSWSGLFSLMLLFFCKFQRREYLVLTKIMKVIFLWGIGFLWNCKACLQVRFNLILWVLKKHSWDSDQKSDKMSILFIDSMWIQKDFYPDSVMVFESDLNGIV